MTVPAAVLEEVGRTYRGGQRVGPVSLTIEPGSCFGLVGANGAGKTTLMRIILGLDRPSEGEVRLFGERVRPDVPPLRTSGMIEEPRFFDWLSGRDNLRAAFPGRSDVHRNIDATLDYVGLSDVDNRPVRAYSQGMRQRLGIARVLLAEPDLLVLDEPTNGLDPLGIRWLRELIGRQTESGRTVLLSSHLLHEVQHTAQEFLMIDQGSEVASGKVAEIAEFSGLEDLYLHVASRPNS